MWSPSANSQPPTLRVSRYSPAGELDRERRGGVLQCWGAGKEGEGCCSAGGAIFFRLGVQDSKTSFCPKGSAEGQGKASPDAKGVARGSAFSLV